jgi:archaellum component FlaG (FlaF/FlaG flagellin family)
MRQKVLLLGSLVILALLAVAGCPLLLGKVGYIELQILAPTASKGIAVSDFEVTGLRIQVRDPEDEVLKRIDWSAEEGPQCYLIPVKQVGEHEIEVTHLGERDGEIVEAAESAVFDVQAKVITIIEVKPGRIGEIFIEEE